MAENEPQPHENNEPEPIAPDQAEQIDELTNDQLDASSEKEEPQQEPDKEEPAKEPQEQPEKKEPPAEQPQQQVQDVDYKKQLEEYKRQVEFFQSLYDGTPPQPQQQQVQQQPQQPVQPQVQQPTDIYETINVSENDLMDLMSGSPERALPVVRNFIRAAVEISYQQQQQRQENVQRAMKYVNLNQEEFYTRFEDLKDYKQIVKIAGDEIEENNMRTGKVKPLHLCLDDIGKRARELLVQLRGNVGGTVSGNGSRTATRNGSRQGNVGGPKVTPPPQQQLTEQQKEMADLLVED
jgi:hypothetical protein